LGPATKKTPKEKRSHLKRKDDVSFFREKIVNESIWTLKKRGGGVIKEPEKKISTYPGTKTA